MSFADELKKAQARMKAAKLQESAAPRRRKKATGGGGTGRRRAVEWTRENEIIAFYLYRSDASKFFKENYSSKRKISRSAMENRMALFQAIHRGRPAPDATSQTMSVFEEFKDTPVPDFQKTVISILRGEYHKAPAVPTGSGAVVRKKSEPEEGDGENS